ncbi:hypothetical protein [Romboutsia lituseburensis]|uniref:hypothetical protein n=1 Tax=Romboutsia lituseburensis TaxID=1537 RepID=UPI00215AEF62|nr:hypothetical protein [Romboutsia lituseburensis]MCR8745205.1 hypothetical protein [Romboutsia lituseburensis]
MDIKKDGFATIECIFSITIVCLGIYIVSNVLYNSYEFTLFNKDRFDMLDIAKSKIEETKYIIKNNSESKINDLNKKDKINKFEVETIIEKNKENYQCYKIYVSVYNEKNNLKLESYVFKQ